MGRKRDANHQDPRDAQKEGCLLGWLDAYVGCSRCCPAAWLMVLGITLTHPGRALSPRAGNDSAAPLPDGRTARRLYAAVRFYRDVISPTQPARCSYKPTCSTYAVQALHRHGALRGTRLIVTRLLRCRPAAARRRGYSDPIPD